MQYLTMEIDLPSNVTKGESFYFTAIRKKLNFDYKMLGKNTMPALVVKPVLFQVIYDANATIHSTVGFRRHKLNAPNPW